MRHILEWRPREEAGPAPNRWGDLKASNDGCPMSGAELGGRWGGALTAEPGATTPSPGELVRPARCLTWSPGNGRKCEGGDRNLICRHDVETWGLKLAARGNGKKTRGTRQREGT